MEGIKALTPKDVGSHRKSINIVSLKRSVVPIKEEKISESSLEIHNLGIPSTRTDAANLIEWMEENVKLIRNDKHKSRIEKVQATQIVYNLVSFWLC